MAIFFRTLLGRPFLCGAVSDIVPTGRSRVHSCQTAKFCSHTSSNCCVIARNVTWPSVIGQNIRYKMDPTKRSVCRRTCKRTISNGKTSRTVGDSLKDKEVLVEECLVPSAADLRKHLKRNRYDVEEGFVCFHIECPFCKLIGEERGQASNTAKFYVNKVSGHCICSCNKVQGPWNSMSDSLSAVKKRRSQAALDIAKNSQKTDSESLTSSALWEGSLCLSTLSERQLQEVHKKFETQGITADTFKSFNVRFHPRKSSLVFPHYGFEQRLSGYNALLVKATLAVIHETETSATDENTKPVRKRTFTRTKESFPKGVLSGLFGFHQDNLQDDQVVLTVSELDAMAVHEALNIPVLALPNATATLPQEILPLFERFKKIILWFGNDIRAWEAAKQFSKKLNSSRCFLIRPLDTQPGPLEALQKGLKLKAILKEATPISHKAIITFSSLREEVLSELTHVEQVAGVKWQRYPYLTKFLKGHRRGELTIFTGPTGSGKTTFMSEYSLDLCNQGVNTLWGSFEIQNVRLAKVMLTQFAQTNLEKNIVKFNKYANQFEQLPLFFMAFHGSQTLQRVIEAMHHAVYVHDIEHVIVDNLQFMVGLGPKQTYSDRFAMYDNSIAAFREFATKNNCHVTVVIHPRKERETEELLTSSIFGSAKASQEADNVLILQDRRLIDPVRGKKYIQVAKNRFDGDLGLFQLHFNKETLTMSPQKQKQARRKKAETTVSPDKIEKEGGDKYEIFEKLMLQSKSEDELGVGE